MLLFFCKKMTECFPSSQIDYTSLADLRMVKYGHLDSKTVVSSDALVTPTKAPNSSTDEKLAAKATSSSTDEKNAGDQTPLESYKSEKEGHIPVKGNVHFMILGVYGVWKHENILMH